MLFTHSTRSYISLSLFLASYIYISHFFSFSLTLQFSLADSLTEFISKFYNSVPTKKKIVIKMTDRVHPRDSPPPQPPVSVNDETSSESSEPMLTLSTRPNPCPDKPVPPPGTYVIHIPKDQVYRVPPPENADRYQALTRKSKTRRRPCCRCLCWSFGILAFLLALLAVSAAIFYLVVKPRSPNYSVDAISVSGLNFTAAAAAASSASLTVSPEFDVTVRADNPNDKIGIYYEPKSSVEIYYDDVSLCEGAVPSFY